MKISFIGLGIMGSRMAANLIKGGVDLTVFNRSKEPVEALLQQGAKTAPNVAEAVKHADIVITMLANPQVVEQVMLGKDGGIMAMKKGALWADCSTVNPSFSLNAAEACKAKEINFLDSPVAGTLPHAQNAELTFFVGGNKEHVEQFTPYMEMMGQKVLHLGENSMGSNFKMLVNAMLAQSMVIFSETILLGEKMGLDKDFLLKVIPGLKVMAPFTAAKVGMIKEDKYSTMFPLELMHKDLHLAAITAYELNQPLHMVNTAKEVFAGANNQGLGRLDFAAVHRYLEQKQV